MTLLVAEGAPSTKVVTVCTVPSNVVSNTDGVAVGVVEVGVTDDSEKLSELDEVEDVEDSVLTIVEEDKDEGEGGLCG
jgi:hypothetical protein